MKWKPPPSAFLKINLGMGVVARDNMGIVKFAMAKSMKRRWSVEQGEAQAALEAVQMAVEMNHYLVQFEGDAQGHHQRLAPGDLKAGHNPNGD